MNNHLPPVGGKPQSFVEQRIVALVIKTVVTPGVHMIYWGEDIENLYAGSRLCLREVKRRINIIDYPS